HDAAGQLVERVDALGRTVRYEHDALGALASRHYDDGRSAIFERDPLGRITRARDAHADVLFERDPAGRVLAETVNGRRVLSYYDLAGRRLRRLTPSGAVSEWDFDARHQPTALRLGGRTMRFGHDPAGHEVQRVLDTGAALTQTWDAAGRLTAQTLSGGTARPRHRVVRHAPGGALIGVLDSANGDTSIDRDTLGRVVGVRGPQWHERYAYDRAANLVHAGEPDTQQWRYTGTRLERAGRTTYHYDGLGRM